MYSLPLVSFPVFSALFDDDFLELDVGIDQEVIVGFILLVNCLLVGWIGLKYSAVMNHQPVCVYPRILPSLFPVQQ